MRSKLQYMIYKTKRGQVKTVLMCEGVGGCVGVCESVWVNVCVCVSEGECVCEDVCEGV